MWAHQKKEIRNWSHIPALGEQATTSATCGYAHMLVDVRVSSLNPGPIPFFTHNKEWVARIPFSFLLPAAMVPCKLRLEKRKRKELTRQRHAFWPHPQNKFLFFLCFYLCLGMLGPEWRRLRTEKDIKKEKGGRRSRRCAPHFLSSLSLFPFSLSTFLFTSTFPFQSLDYVLVQEREERKGSRPSLFLLLVRTSQRLSLRDHKCESGLT